MIKPLDNSAGDADRIKQATVWNFIEGLTIISEDCSNTLAISLPVMGPWHAGVPQALRWNCKGLKPCEERRPFDSR